MAKELSLQEANTMRYHDYPLSSSSFNNIRVGSSSTASQVIANVSEYLEAEKGSFLTWNEHSRKHNIYDDSNDELLPKVQETLFGKQISKDNSQVYSDSMNSF